MDGTTTLDARSLPLVFAGFWRRLGAAAIDAIVLGILGWILGAMFYDSLVALGAEGRLIGLPIALLYFAVGNSGRAGGTLGKHAMDIRVVTRDGDGISLPRALWRAAIFLVPLYLNNLDFSFLMLPPLALTILLTIDVFMVFGVSGATTYLYLANWQTRQVVHDLAAGTFVVRGAGGGIDRHINPVHLVVIGLFWFATLAAMPLTAHYLGPDWQPHGTIFGVDMDALRKIQTAIEADPEVQTASVIVNTTRVAMLSGARSTTTALTITVIHRGRIDDAESFANKIAQRVLTLYPDALGRDRLVVVVRYGFDIGIASNWSGHGYDFTVAEWRARLRLPPLHSA